MKKLIVIISIESSWSRYMVEVFLKKQVSIYAIDVSARTGYQSNSLDKQNLSEIDLFKSKLEYYRHIETKNSFLKVFQLAKEINKLKNSFGSIPVFSCYAGMSSLGAYLSFVRPYYIYIVGSDVLLLNLYKGALYNLIFSNAEIVYSNGKHLIDRTSEMYKDVNYKLKYIGIDTTLISQSEIPKEKSEKVTFICTRGFDTIYNNLFILKAFHLLPLDLLKKVRLIFTSTGELLDQSINYVADNFDDSIKENFIFLKGTNYREIINQLSQSNIYLSLSFSDGISLSLLEGMLAGLFPVVSDIEGNREVVEDGIFISPFDVSKFAEVLKKIIDEKDTYLNFDSSKNKNKVLDHFDINKNMINVYNEIFKNQGTL